MSRLIVKNCTFANGTSGNVEVDNAFVERVNYGVKPHFADNEGVGTIIDAHGGIILPGAIDIHVHFRDPGLTHKATIASESLAAVSGGVTSFVDMPNTVPQTVTMEHVEQKQAIASKDSKANYGFFIGATVDNIDSIANVDFSRVAGVKLFMGSSTGGMLIGDDRIISKLFECVPKGIPVVVHAEDDSVISQCRENIVRLHGADPDIRFHSAIRPAEACVRATERALELAARYGTRLHLAHVSTSDELSLFSAGEISDKQFTCEVSPHHLLWCDDDYARCGSRIKMNPSVKSAADREALRKGVLDGHIDVIATDHAPHLLSEKQGGALKAVSGAPMVQFSVAAMLDMFGADVVSRLMARNPARLLGIDRRGEIAAGMYADLILVDPCDAYTVCDKDVVSLCQWTPMAGCELHHRVRTLAINGSLNNPMPLNFVR